MKRWTRALPALCTALMLFSCATTSKQTQELPEWAVSLPNLPGYYIGIGHAGPDAGEEGRTIARDQALTEIAAQISTSLKSQIIIEESEDSSGARYEKISRVMEERIQITLEEVEQVDTFYSDDHGYWVYMRISQETLGNMKTRLESDILSDIEGVEKKEESSVSEMISVLLKSRDRILSSPFAGVLSFYKEGNRYSLLDYVEREIRSQASAITISLEIPERLEWYEKTLQYRITVATGSERLPGSIPLLLQFISSMGESRVKTVTDRMGDASGAMTIPAYAEGEGSLSATIDAEALDLSDDLRITLPSTSASMVFLPPAVRLEIETIEAPRKSEYVARVSSFFSGVLEGVDIEQGATERKLPVLRTTLSFRYAPSNDYGLVIAYLRAVSTLEYEGTIALAYEIPEVKEGGLDVEQARTRVFDKFISLLKEEAGIAETFLKELLGESGPG